MSDRYDLEALVAQAKEQEEAYDWLGAAGYYKQALEQASDLSESKLGELYEAYGYAVHKAAMQSDTKEDFRNKTVEAISIYDKACLAYQEPNSPLTTARNLRCKTMIAQLGFWLEADARGKRKLLDDSWKAARETLDILKQAGEPVEYARTYRDVVLTSIFDVALEWDFSSKERLIAEVIDYGQKTARLLLALERPKDLARIYAILAVWLSISSFNHQTPEAQGGDAEKASDYWRKALGFSEEEAILEYSRHPLGEDLLGVGSEEALATSRKAVEYARKTRDRLSIGSALDKLAYHTTWWQQRPEDVEERKSYVKQALQLAEEARRTYSPLSFVSPRFPLWTEAPNAGCYRQLSYHETNLSKKRGLLESALQLVPGMLRLAEESGYPEVIGDAYGESAYIVEWLSELESKPDEKKRYLEQALEYIKRASEVSRRVQPFFYWNTGLNQGRLSKSLAGLAKLASDPDNKRRLLLEAVRNGRQYVRLCLMQMPHIEKTGSPSMMGELGNIHFGFGDLLCQLHEVTDDPESLKEAATAYLGAAKLWERISSPSRVAECYWKAAQAYDDLNDYGKSSESFQLASQKYKETAKNLPKHETFYYDHATYMQAWDEIEKARQHHARGEYSLAEEYYNNAAGLHASTGLWAFLTPNYRAWAQVERAEDLSRKEKCEEAIRAFLKAEGFFGETRASLQTQTAKVEGDDQKQMIDRLVRATDPRQEYCKARIAIEEAKILDRKGDHHNSSDKYASAADNLHAAMGKAQSQKEKREFNAVMVLAKAWQAMTKAEAEASPELYLEASRFFGQAKELSPTEKGKALALGHSRFCRALEAGTRFSDTKDSRLHASAIDHLESAARYYIKAGYENASEYAEASRQLFDAYAHMDSAAHEQDAEKKARLYTMAETVLQSSADSYLRAEHPEKRNEVQGLLDRVRKDRQLTISLMIVLRTPSIVSTTEAFRTPLSSHEGPAGLERFAYADIQAKTTVKPRNVWVGDRLSIELELVNTGRGSAQLLTVEGILQEGFERVEEPDFCSVENGHLNMRGKRLDPLKTQGLQIIMKPQKKGVFTIRPRVMYSDESGGYKHYEAQPVEVRVKGGLPDWVRGR